MSKLGGRKVIIDPSWAEMVSPSLKELSTIQTIGKRKMKHRTESPSTIRAFFPILPRLGLRWIFAEAILP